MPNFKGNLYEKEGGNAGDIGSWVSLDQLFFLLIILFFKFLNLLPIILIERSINHPLFSSLVDKVLTFIFFYKN